MFYEKVREHLVEFDNDYYIICGDFNLALNQTLDTFNYSNVNNPRARNKLIEIMNETTTELLILLKNIHMEKEESS